MHSETLQRYSRVTAEIVQAIAEIVGDSYVLTSPDDLDRYSRDETEDLCFLPEIVVKPQNTKEISEIMKLCNSCLIPVTPRGGGTGLSGGALPVFGGIVLSTERLNRIIEIDAENLMAVVEPGVVTQTFQEEVEKRGFFYPPDPASRGSCFLGGNIAECAGGPRAIKYGVTKDYVYGLEAVLPTGEIVQLGGKLLKNVSGYNLVQLLIGSEGTLAIITKIILKLLPLPKCQKTLLVPFDSVEQAARTVTRLFHRRVIPAAAEFIERAAIQAAERRAEKKFPFSEHEALLLLEIDGNDRDALERESEAVGEICVEGGAFDVLFADSSEKQKALWDMRRSIGEAVKSISIYKEEDTVVPRARLPELVKAIRQISEKYGITAISYGHAGDGNLHVNILKGDMDDLMWNEKLPTAVSELFQAVVAMGGAISGEHGIGWTQKEYLPIALKQTELDLMQRIKEAFDPNGILNPGKIFCAGS